jgi:hypothetical protein
MIQWYFIHIGSRFHLNSVVLCVCDFIPNSQRAVAKLFQLAEISTILMAMPEIVFSAL